MSKEDHSEKYFDTVSYFECVQDILSDKINNMEKICWDLEKKELTDATVQKLTGLNEGFHDEFLKYYTIEEDLLFPELEKVLPSPTSTTSMRDEHAKILQLNLAISEILKEPALTVPPGNNSRGNIDEIEKNKQTLISTIYSFVDIVQRHIHKKNSIVYHEASAFLSEKTLSEIYRRIKERIS